MKSGNEFLAYDARTDVKGLRAIETGKLPKGVLLWSHDKSFFGKDGKLKPPTPPEELVAETPAITPDELAA